MFSCSLCRSQCQEYVFLHSHCSKCEEIRRIISLYSVDKVLDTLRYVYLRDDDTKVKKRANVEGSREYNLRSKKKKEDKDDTEKEEKDKKDKKDKKKKEDKDYTEKEEKDKKDKKDNKEKEEDKEEEKEEKYEKETSKK